MSYLRPSTTLDAELESRPPADRIAYLENRLRQTVAHAYTNAPRFRVVMDAAGLGPHDVRRLGDLARLPLTAKDELPALQAADPPFGGLTAVPARSLQRIFCSPGNIFDPQGQGRDFWRFRPALAAAGFRAGDIVLNTFAYHLTPAGFMFDGALRSLGCVVVPTGPGHTELQVRIASHLGATGYVGTPSFLYAILGNAAGIAAARAGDRFRHPRAARLRHRRRRHAGLRVPGKAGAASAPRGDRRDPRPRAPRTGRAGAAGRGRGDDLRRGLSLDSLRHRRPQQLAPRTAVPLRAHRAEARGHPGTGRRRSQGQGNVRAPEPARRGRQGLPRGGAAAGGGDALGAPGPSSVPRGARRRPIGRGAGGPP